MKTNETLSPAFRAFTDADYKTFSGVETRDPRIAELPWGVVILDGERVEVVLADEPLTSFACGFFQRAPARLVAEHLAAMPVATSVEIEQYLQRI